MVVGGVPKGASFRLWLLANGRPFSAFLRVPHTYRGFWCRLLPKSLSGYSQKAFSDKNCHRARNGGGSPKTALGWTVSSGPFSPRVANSAEQITGAGQLTRALVSAPSLAPSLRERPIPAERK